MESKLQELTQKLYKEGVEKANKEADIIVSDAKKQAEQIIENAKKDADSIIENSKKEASQLNDKVLSELKLAGNQAISSLKQEITDLLSSNSLDKDIKNIVNDNDFVKKMTMEIVKKWTDKTEDLDLNLILPEKDKDNLIKYYKNNAKEMLEKGVELKFESRMEHGFKISPKNGSFILSFTEKDFEMFFQSFLKPKTREILFS